MNNSLLNLLKSYQSFRSLKFIHARLIIEGFISSSEFSLNRLIRICSRLGHMPYARKVFEQIPQPNSFHWTALIHGHVENQCYNDALLLFNRMQTECVPPLNFTISSVLKALSRQTRLRDGEIVCGLISKLGFDSDLTVQNSVIDLYSRCKEVELARRVFDEMPERDIVTWNSMISCYSNYGRVETAGELFGMMPERNVVSWTTIIGAYVKIGDMVKARELFEIMPERDVISWKVMMGGYIEIGDLMTASRLFEKMPSRDISSWNLMICGFCKERMIESARDIFDRMPNRNVVSWVMMIEGYIKMADLNTARILFDQMPEKNLVSWTAMIAGYEKHGQPNDALELFKQFKEKNIAPDETFILVIISTCSQLGILDIAEEIVHEYMGHMKFSNIQLLTSLIDMYAKCGSVEKAFQVFKKANKKDVFCYSTMIAAYANHGMAADAVALFGEMLKEGLEPDGVTFLGILTACNHGGFVKEGVQCFKLMVEDFNVEPSERHYACLVDLLGRAGFLCEAYKLIKSMQVEAQSSVWGALLSACRVHRNVDLAEIAASRLFEIEPENSGNYVLLCNIYASAERWNDVARVRALIRERRVKKNKGSSWIELGHVVHEFVMEDKTHPYSEHIFSVLYLLSDVMKMSEYEQLNLV